MAKVLNQPYSPPLPLDNGQARVVPCIRHVSSISQYDHGWTPGAIPSINPQRTVGNIAPGPTEGVPYNPTCWWALDHEPCRLGTADRRGSDGGQARHAGLGNGVLKKADIIVGFWAGITVDSR